jgi:hypothetical protein
MRLPILALAVLLTTACPAAPEPSPIPATNAPADIPLTVRQRQYLFSLAEFLHRWVMDEHDFARIHPEDGKVSFWLKEIPCERDESDQSRWIKVVLPDVGIEVDLKNSLYRIEELDLVISNDTFKVTNVSRRGPGDRPDPNDYVRATFPLQELREYLFQSRTNVLYPEAALREYMREATRKKLVASGRAAHVVDPSGIQTIHLAPLSPVANVAWVFWETGRMLLRFSSDLDLANPALWKLGDLTVDTYDIDEQMVVSLDEAPGSNAYLTRDQIGRVLYNCIVLGKRFDVPLADAPPAADQP